MPNPIPPTRPGDPNAFIPALAGTPTQGASIPELLDAVTNRLVLWTQLQDAVIEWSGDNPAARVPVEGKQFLVGINIPEVRPQPDPGSGITGWPMDAYLDVVLWSTYQGTWTGQRREWNRRHYPVLAYCWQALVGKMLFAGYNNAIDTPNPTTFPGGTGFPEGRPLLTGLVRPDRSQTVTTEFKSTFGYSQFSLVLPTMLPMDIRQQV